MSHTEKVLPSRFHLSVSFKLPCLVIFVSQTSGWKKFRTILFFRSARVDSGGAGLGGGLPFGVLATQIQEFLRPREMIQLLLDPSCPQPFKFSRTLIKAVNKISSPHTGCFLHSSLYVNHPELTLVTSRRVFGLISSSLRRSCNPEGSP